MSRIFTRNVEVLQVREDNTLYANDVLRKRISDRKQNPVVFQIGIAASGFGSFEQILIGRTFLYDRLYHHHKVRAAEAMAQRMLLVVEVRRTSLTRTKSSSAADLARGILKRRLHTLWSKNI